MAGINHADSKVSGNKGYASEWNKDHNITDDVNWNNKKITNLADPTANQEAATKKYVDDIPPGLWEVDGTETQLKTADEIDMRSKKILNLTDPVANQDAATKKYVDDNIPLSFSRGSQTFSYPNGTTGTFNVNIAPSITPVGAVVSLESNVAYNQGYYVQITGFGAGFVTVGASNQTGLDWVNVKVHVIAW